MRCSLVSSVRIRKPASAGVSLIDIAAACPAPFSVRAIHRIRVGCTVKASLLRAPRIEMPPGDSQMTQETRERLLARSVSLPANAIP